MKFSSFVLLPAAVLASPLDQSTQQAPQQVTISSSTYSGSGCPQGSVSSIISPDKTTITFGFDSFQALIGPSAPQGGQNKNCQLHLDLRYPSGFQMSLMTATYHGFVRLDAGVQANFISQYYFSQAAAKTANSRITLSGPDYLNGRMYTKEDKIENASVVWSPCGANGILNINNRIALSNSGNRNGQGEISSDDATVRFEQKIRVQWRRCTGNSRIVEPASLELGDVDTTVDVV